VGQSTIFLDSQQVEIDQVVDVDVGVAVETFTEVDARAEMFGECCQLRDLIAVLESWLEALELRNSRSIQITAEERRVFAVK